MKLKICFILILFAMTFLIAQRHEVGMILGGANSVADIGNEKYINPKNPAAQVFYKRNLNNRYSVRISAGITDLKMNDADADSQYRLDRGLMTENKIYDGALTFEFNFFDFNDPKRFAHTPYIFAGAGITSYEKPRIEAIITPNNGSVDYIAHLTAYRKRTIAPTIPFGIGYKFKINYRWVLGAELGFRYTFTDNIDKSNPAISAIYSGISEDLAQNALQEIKNNYNIGRINSNDWYTFTGVILAYTFGRPPCDCGIR